MSTSEQPNVSRPDPRPTGDVFATGWLSSQSMFGEHDPHQGRRAAGAAGASLAIHGLLLLIVAGVFTYRAATAPPEEEKPLIRMVYLQQPGPGGGGGGSPAPAPPKPIEIPRTKPPAPVPVTPIPPPPVIPPPAPTFSAPIMTPDASIAQATGTSSVSLANYGGGGRGTGLGRGTGSGVGEGTGGGTGGGVFRLGAGIQNPVLLREIKPTYTSDAMRAKIQGSVELEVVVLADGTVGDVKVTKSLDRVNGLDQEAIKAAKQWRFRPAMDREGKPVPVYVGLILDFRLH